MFGNFWLAYTLELIGGPSVVSKSEVDVHFLSIWYLTFWLGFLYKSFSEQFSGVVAHLQTALIVLLQISPQILLRIYGSGLCDGHTKALTLLSLSHFITTLTNLRVIVHFEISVCPRALTSWRISLRVASIFSRIFSHVSFFIIMCPWFFCSEKGHKWCCHPNTSQLACLLLTNVLVFTSKCNNGPYDQTVPL